MKGLITSSSHHFPIGQVHLADCVECCSVTVEEAMISNVAWVRIFHVTESWRLYLQMERNGLPPFEFQEKYTVHRDFCFPIERRAINQWKAVKKGLSASQWNLDLKKKFPLRRKQIIQENLSFSTNPTSLRGASVAPFTLIGRAMLKLPTFGSRLKLATFSTMYFPALKRRS